MIQRWEGMMIEQVIGLEGLRGGAQFWFYRTQSGAEINLMVERGTDRIGYEFKCAASAAPRDTSGLKAGIADGVITRGMVIHAGQRSYPLGQDIEAVPAAELLLSSDHWRFPGLR